MAVLEDRGLFWWNNQRVPKDQFAPKEFVHGKLTISDDGQISLELDTAMPGHNAWDNIASQNKPAPHNIQGLLNTKSDKVLLLGLIQGGGAFRSNNLSPETYIAANCLISGTRFRVDTAASSSYSAIKVELKGFEDWLWLRSITSDRKRSRLFAKYVVPKRVQFTLPFGKLVIEYDLLGPWLGKFTGNKLNLTESAAIRLKPNARITLESAQTYYQRIEELILLLTSYDLSLDWPTVTLSNGQHAKNYFLRSKVNAKPPGAHECLINFPKIAAAFGDLFSTLLRKREEFGPGFYLYFGTRRGMKMFIEHRFVNFIWGLEAFDRRGRGSVATGTLLNEKITRILNEVTNRHDQRWLAKKLRHTGEPSLAERLFDVFKNIPLEYDHKALRRFCEECQNRRNDISHWGGLRHEDQNYQAFMRDIDTKSDALSALYHLHLLVVIGIDCERLNFRTNNSWPLSRMEMDLRRVGILKPLPL